MNGWGATQPAWWLNLQAYPEAIVELAGGIRREVVGSAVVGEDRERLWGSAGANWTRTSPATLRDARARRSSLSRDRATEWALGFDYSQLVVRRLSVAGK